MAKVLLIFIRYPPSAPSLSTKRSNKALHAHPLGMGTGAQSRIHIVHENHLFLENFETTNWQIPTQLNELSPLYCVRKQN